MKDVIQLLLGVFAASLVSKALYQVKQKIRKWQVCVCQCHYFNGMGQKNAFCSECCRLRNEKRKPEDSKDDVEMCVICLSKLAVAGQESKQDNGNEIQLKCAHRFHSGCISKWVQRRRRCPLCRHCVSYLPSTSKNAELSAKVT